MKIKDYKCKCEHNDFFFADKGNQTGIYCSYCGKWLKWADKNEQNLRMKQMSVLGRVRAEIKDWQTDIHDNEYNAESHDFVFERIYEIIDEHKD